MSFVNQSQSVVKQNQCKREITSDTIENCSINGNCGILSGLVGDVNPRGTI